MSWSGSTVRRALAFVALTFAGSGSADLKRDETLVFFRTAARPSADERHWIVPIHGWIYEPQDSSLRKSAVAAMLKARYGLEATPSTQANFDRRTNLFFSDNEGGKSLTLQMAGQRFELPASRPNGHFEAELLLGAEAVEPGALLTYRALLGEGDARDLEGESRAIPRRVISDIDDTVKVTQVRDRAALLDNTFFQDFRPVTGMAAKYSEWAEHGAVFHFVSSSPWQLHEPLREFLEASGFPAALFHLKSVRLKDETLLELFRPGTETKPRQIEPILRHFPDRRFVLVGDSGEQDPEVYAALLRRHPEQIARVYIRNVTLARPGDERFGPLFEGLPAAKWALFRDPAVLRLPEPGAE